MCVCVGCDVVCYVSVTVVDDVATGVGVDRISYGIGVADVIDVGVIVVVIIVGVCGFFFFLCWWCA